MTYSIDLTATSGAPADGKTTNSATATMKSGSDFISGEILYFMVSGSAKFTDGTQTTHATTGSLGTATINFTDTVSETVTITAASVSEGINNTASATFGKGGGGETDDYQLTVTATSGAAPDGEATNDVTVTLANKQGTPLARQIIDLSVSGSAQFLDESTTTVITDKNGSYVVTITDTAEEKVTITAVFYDDDGATILAQATGTSSFGQADSDYLLTVTAVSGAKPDGIAANAVTVTLTDKQGKPQARKIIDLAVNKNALFKDGEATTLSVVTDAAGKHETGIVDEFEETVTVSAQYLDDDAVTVLARASDESGFGQANSPYIMTLDAESGASADGEAENKVVITVKERESGAPVHRGIIQIKASGSAVFRDSGEQTTEGVTNTEGKVTFLLTDTVEESVHLQAELTAAGAIVNVDGDTSFGPAQHYTLLVDAKDGAQANGKATNAVTVALKDGDGQPVKGADITLSVDGDALLSNGKGSITVTTNSKGLASDALTDVTIESVTITAMYKEGDISATGNSRFDEVEEDYSVLFKYPNVIEVGQWYTSKLLYIQGQLNGQEADVSNIEVYTSHADMRDSPSLIEYGNHYNGQPNNSSSLFTCQLKGTKPDAYNLINGTVTFADGTERSFNTTIAIEDGYQLTVKAADGALANGKATNPVTVTLKDIDGQAVKGAEITLSVNGDALMSNGKGSHTVTTDGKGQATDTLTDVTAETVTVTASYEDNSATDTSSFSERPKEVFEDFELNDEGNIPSRVPYTLNRSGAILNVGFGYGRIENIAPNPQEPGLAGNTFVCQKAGDYIEYSIDFQQPFTHCEAYLSVVNPSSRDEVVFVTYYEADSVEVYNKGFHLHEGDNYIHIETGLSREVTRIEVNMDFSEVQEIRMDNITVNHG